jgi:small subunit ribosomal protein S3
MGQKVNPHGLRVGVIKDWDSRWFANDSDFGDTLVSDYKIRKYLKEKLKVAGVPKIEIERSNTGVKVVIHCAKPGVVIGRGGAEIEKLRVSLEKMTGKSVSVNVAEVKSPDMNAQLVAESIAEQLEKRVAFRRAMKQAIGRTMRLGAKGIKIAVSGRLGGAEIARTEHYHEGTIPLQTLRADIDYGFFEANTTYGKIGVKVWIYTGEVLHEVSKTANNKEDRPRRRFNNNGRNDRQDGNRGRRAPRAPRNNEGGAN